MEEKREEYDRILLEKDRLEREIFNQERELNEKIKLNNRDIFSPVNLSDSDKLKYKVIIEQEKYNNILSELEKTNIDINTLELYGDNYGINDTPNINMQELKEKRDNIINELNSNKEKLSETVNLFIENLKSEITNIETQKNTITGYNPEMLTEEEMNNEVERYDEEIRKLSEQLEFYQKQQNKITNEETSNIHFEKELEENFNISSLHKNINSLEAEVNTIEMYKENLKLSSLLTEEELNSELSKYDEEIEELKKEIDVNNKKLTEIINKNISSIDGEINTLLSNKEALETYQQGMVPSEEIEKIDKQIEELKKKQKDYVGLLPNGIKTYKWDINLTDEQKEDLWNKGIKPGTKEYEDKLTELGIVSETKKINELKSQINDSKNKLNSIKNELNSFNEQKNDTKLEQDENLNEEYSKAVEEISEEVKQAIDNTEKTFGKIDDDLKNEIIKNEIEKHLNSGKYDDLCDNKEKLIEDIINNINKEKDKEKDKDKIIDVDYEEIPEEEKVEPVNKNNDNTREEEKNEPVIENNNNSSEKENKEIELKKNEKVWLKCLSGATGFALGVGLNVVAGTVPLLGTAITVYAAGRTLYNGAKFINNIATKINKGNEPQIITKIKDKIPDKVKQTADKIFSSPNNPYARWFVNGMSLGYLADRMFDIHEKVGNTFSKANAVENEVNITPKQTQMEPPKDIINNKEPIISQTIDIPTLNPGDTMDISSILEGYASSYGDGFTTLDTSRGVGAIFDKVNNGMYHFLQPNGEGYAWIPKEEIDKLLEEMAKTGGKVH